MHNGFLNVDNEKMSKSLGNFFTIRDVLKRYDGETMRFFMLRTHYRSPFNFSDAHLDDARNALRRLYTALDVAPAADECAVDWSRPAGRRVPRRDGRRLQHARRGGGAVRAGRRSQSHRVQPATAALLEGAGRHARRSAADAPRLPAGGQLRSTTPTIELRIAERAAAKKAREFARADRIRDELAAQGIVLQGLAAGHDLGQGLTCR